MPSVGVACVQSVQTNKNEAFAILGKLKHRTPDEPDQYVSCFRQHELHKKY